MVKNQLVYNIDGLWCGGCAEAVQSKLLKKHKIKSSIDLATQTIQLPNQLNVDLKQIKKTIKNLGYELSEFYDFDEKTRIDKKITRSMLTALAVLIFSFIWVMAFSSVSYFKIMGELDSSDKKTLVLLISLFSLPGLLYGGKYIYLSAIRNIRINNFNIDSLITLSVSGCVLLTGLNFYNKTYETFLDSALMALTLFTIIKLFDRGTLQNSLHDLKSIDQDRLKEVSVLTSSGDTLIKKMSQVKKGQLVNFTAGQELIFDGVIVDGEGLIDCSKNSGESFLRKISKGNSVISGTVVHEGFIKLEVKRPFKERLIDQSLLNSVNNFHKKTANQKRSVLNFISLWAAPLLMLSSFLFFLLNYFLLNKPFNSSALNSISILLIFCPCVLFISKPILLIRIVKSLCKKGIKIHNPRALDIFPQIENAIFDKTGTLTGNDLYVSFTEISSKFDANSILGIAASLEENIVHPLSSAFLKKAYQNNISYKPIDSKYFPSRGVQGTIDGNLYRLGKSSWATDIHSNGTELVLTENKEIIARFTTKTLDDSSVHSELKALKKIGFKLFLITGDSETNAKMHLKDSILYFESAYFETSVVEKGILVSGIKKEHGCCIYFGDGDNDLEAFNSSDISVSTVSASRFSRSTSDIQSATIDSRFMLEMKSAALKLKRRQIQNYFLAATYNLIIVTFLFFINFSPGLAILAMSISSSLIIINAIRE